MLHQDTSLRVGLGVDDDRTQLADLQGEDGLGSTGEEPTRIHVSALQAYTLDTTRFYSFVLHAFMIMPQVLLRQPSLSILESSRSGAS